MNTRVAERPAVAGTLLQKEDKQLPAVQKSNATALLQAITTAAADPKVDIEKMERLFKMHQQMVAKEAEAAFNAAMARAQGQIQPIVNNRLNTHTSSGYADLAAINTEIVPIYTAEGLSVSFDTETQDEDDPVPASVVRVVGIVSHAAGHSRRHHIDLPPDASGAQGKVNKTGVQAAGSTNSYARRYLLRMIFNISTEDDNDGNGGRQKRGERGEKEPYPQEQFAKNLPAWCKLMEERKKTASQIIAIVQSRYQLSEQQAKQIRDKEPKE